MRDQETILRSLKTQGFGFPGLQNRIRRRGDEKNHEDKNTEIENSPSQVDLRARNQILGQPDQTFRGENDHYRQEGNKESGGESEERYEKDL